MHTGERFCDRCGDGEHYNVLEEFALHDQRYYLCGECAATIIALWLMEHELLIAGQRRERRRARRQTERRSKGHDQ